jgi:hypothetical protein
MDPAVLRSILARPQHWQPAIVEAARARLDRLSSEPAVETRFCPECGKTIPGAETDERGLCPECASAQPERVETLLERRRRLAASNTTEPAEVKLEPTSAVIGPADPELDPTDLELDPINAVMDPSGVVTDLGVTTAHASAVSAEVAGTVRADSLYRVRPPERSPYDIREVAVAQKHLIAAVALTFFISIFALPYQLYALYRIAGALKKPAPIICLVGLVPCFNLLIMLWLNDIATRALKDSGVRVGFFGADLSRFS